MVEQGADDGAEDLGKEMTFKVCLWQHVDMF